MKIIVNRPDGAVEELSAKPGSTLMEALRDGGAAVRAECGGACACATCHVHVPSEWSDETGEASDEERDLLEDSDYFVADASRLACQITLSEPMDGLTVALQLDAFEG